MKSFHKDKGCLQERSESERNMNTTGLDEFHSWPKIPRLRRDIVVTEKIDGTNGQISIRPFGCASHDEFDTHVNEGGYDVMVRAGSRNRWLSAQKGADNYNFAAWVHDNATALVAALGLGRHYGEWYGQGIQRNYGMDERRFALFDTSVDQTWTSDLELDVVPVLCRRTFGGAVIEDCLNELADHGSRLSPGFMNPEGVIVYHTASNQMFKQLLDGDELPKGVAPRAERELAAANAALKLAAEVRGWE